MRNTRWRTAFLALLCLFLSVQSRGQDLYWTSFEFRNRSGPALDAPIFDAGGDRLFGTNYAVMLYGGRTVDALAPAMTASGAPAQTTVSVVFNGLPGYFYGGHVWLDIPYWEPKPWLQVRVWDTLLGPTYEEVSALGQGGYGESNLFQEQGGHQSFFGEPPVLPAPLRGLESFRLHEVPEPGAAGFALLGAAIVLSSRQRLRRRT